MCITFRHIVTRAGTTRLLTQGYLQRHKVPPCLLFPLVCKLILMWQEPLLATWACNRHFQTDRCLLGIQIRPTMCRWVGHSPASHLVHLLVPRTQPQLPVPLHQLVMSKLHNRCPSMVFSQGLRPGAHHSSDILLGISKFATQLNPP